MAQGYNPSDPLGLYKNNSQQESTATRIFHTAVVAEFISNPSRVRGTLLRELSRGRAGKGDNLVNSRFISKMPMNSIVGIRVSDGSGIINVKEIFYPFFSPHLCLPVKPGEHVWVIYEKTNDRTLGYWVSRKCSDLQVDDLNFTHSDRVSQYKSREKASPFLLNLNQGGSDRQIRAPGFPNGDPNTSASRTLRDSNGYSMIVKKALSYGGSGGTNEFIGEAVPRITKKVGDVVFQGSNNTSIILGTDYGATGTRPIKSFGFSMLDPGQGAIDICAGRGQTKASAGAFEVGGVTNTRGYNETPKHPKREIRMGVDNPAEGTPDLSTDLSRIYVSMKTDVDNIFSIDVEGMDRSEGGKPAIVLKSDQLRLVARDDLKITIGDAETGSSVVLKADGNIVFIPGPEGIIKLGGDDADKAILTTNPLFTSESGGTVSAVPVVTVAQGILGYSEGSPQLASIAHFSTLATKVLVK